MYKKPGGRGGCGEGSSKPGRNPPLGYPVTGKDGELYSHHKCFCTTDFLINYQINNQNQLTFQ